VFEEYDYDPIIDHKALYIIYDSDKDWTLYMESTTDWKLINAPARAVVPVLE
jgi:hypothetical protein